MQIFPVGRVYDFMGRRRLLALLSCVLIAGSLFLLVNPGPRLGTDFRGGTEIELAFTGEVNGTQIRQAVAAGGFSSPDVIQVQDEDQPHRFLIRVEEVSTIDAAKQAEVNQALCFGEQETARCADAQRPVDVKFSPGGDKIVLRYSEAPDLQQIRKSLEPVSGIQLREGQNPVLQNARDHRVECLLNSKGDQLMSSLRAALGATVVPESPLRVEWVGPKAGAQLRDSAFKSIAIALVFVMVYIAFRFDLRFAPGAVLALVHDSIVTVGVLTALQKELNLSTVAALLTIVGYSVNDTVVVYDRVRENLGKLRGATFTKIINTSLSEMLSRTVLTSTTTIFALLAFFVWGTGTLKDFALTLIVGLFLGTYSSIYVALPLTSWLDRRFFGKPSSRAKGARQTPRKKTAAVV